MRGTCLAAILVAGCGGGSGGHGCFIHCDAGGGDLAGGGFDAGDDGPVTHGDSYRYAINKLNLPKQRVDFAFDLNGDGKPDNALGNIIGALAAQNLDAQAAQDMQTASGAAVHLLDVETSDPMLSDDQAVVTTLYVGQPGQPDFSGNGTFAVDQGQSPAVLSGALATRHFASESPVTTKQPASFRLTIGLLGATPLPLHGVHVQFDTGTDMSSGAPGLVNGQLHGSIKNSDVQMTVIPSIAASLTASIKANPNSMSSQQIRQLFDVGGCVDQNGQPAVAGDLLISTCEVATNMIIQNVLAPDVNIYDANGKYAPSPDPAGKDSLSVGVGFTAVRASF